MTRLGLLALATALPGMALAESHMAEGAGGALSYGERPFFLIEAMQDGPLKDKLMSCQGQSPERTAFSIAHRGAPMMIPEHTRQSYVAGARQGAGIVECDVTFTADHELVCRHAQNDLATTTDIVVSDLGAKCTSPFTPAGEGTEAAAECRTSDITLAEFRELNPKMDAADKTATTAEEFQGGTAAWRTDLYVDGTQLMTHAESIALIDSLGADFTPELKAASVEMPHDGFSQEDYAQKLIDEYKAAGIDPSRVWAQSFNLDDIKYWIENEPEFGAQAVYLDDRYEAEDDDEGLIDPMDPSSFKPTMAELAEMGVNYIAPPMWMLVTTDEAGEIVASPYAEEAKAAGLKIIAWSLERSGPLAAGGGWYFQSVSDVIDDDGDTYAMVDALAQDVGVEGIFSDWPATVTYYANCMGL
ncbi:glycerophosphodiester phosphodiesterase family protein [Limimaricola hongkongensis]|uniref:glycerophosphodiester phosphodiesterase n=1 Tax=Limimaricola hongkongensis DSM 17492 TaxID=1122180 RepID=A0A017H832_9RHOB|nr:Glycerophosphoryl diester phosphodiesterase [Limimaricola hongkongensis DSM 17492]